MLSPADEAVLERDRALPGLRLALDGDALLAALRRARPDRPVQSARLRYVRYKPGTDCLAGYALGVPEGELLVHVKTYARRTQGKLEKLARRPQTPGPLGPGRVFLEDGLTVVTAFPEDARLRGLARFHDPRGRARLLRELTPSRHADTVEARVLVYKPERRCVFRLTADGAAVAVVKLYTRPGYLGALSGAQAFAPRERLGLAPRLGACERHGAIAWEWVDGALLSEALAAPAFDPRAVMDVGAALAELHAQDAPRLAVAGQGDEAEALVWFAAGLEVLGPVSQGRAVRLAERLAARLTEGPLRELRPAHGDFYAKQVLAGPRGTTTLLDMDEAVRADPGGDLGNFIAHLERSALRGEIGAARAAAAREALLDGYGAVSGGWLPARLDAFVAARLLRLALDPFRHREPDWSERAERILDRVEHLCAAPHVARPTAAPRAGVAPWPPEGPDPALPFLPAALMPGVAEGWLAALPAFAGTRPEVRQARLLRHKRGRRCVVEYELVVGRGTTEFTIERVVGKARARGVDERSHRLACALWRGGFGSDTSDGISIPEPLGCVPEAHMWIQRKVPGLPSGVLLDVAGGAVLARRLASALRKLQAQGPAPGRAHDLSSELRALRERLTLLARARPAWSARLERLLKACERLGADVAPCRPVPVHRDFHPDQVLVDGRRLYLLDLDLYAEGDPALDAGNFSAHLRERAVREPREARALHAAADALLEACVEPGRPGSRAALRTYESLALVRLIDVSTRIPERRPFTRSLLETCEERLLAGAPRRTAWMPSACVPEGAA